MAAFARWYAVLENGRSIIAATSWIVKPSESP